MDPARSAASHGTLIIQLVGVAVTLCLCHSYDCVLVGFRWEAPATVLFLMTSFASICDVVLA